MRLVSEDVEKNPLNLPELRTRIGLFLDPKDCLSCMRVSRDWFGDFVKPVWHTIDYAKDQRFNNIGPMVLDKYGSLIKRALNISTFEHIFSLQHPKVDSINALNIVLMDDWLFQELVADLIRRCKGRITDLTMLCPLSQIDTVVEQRRRARIFIHISMLMTTPMPSSASNLSHGHCLENLELSRVCITREGFSALLQFSPVLRKIKLFKVVILRHNPAFKVFRDSSVTYLDAPMGDTLMPDPESPNSPSLLAHFPLLQKWFITCLHRPTAWTNEAVRSEISTQCPLLTNIRFGRHGTETLDDLLLNCTQNLKSCSFSAYKLNMSTAFACISHLQTLTSITLEGTLRQHDSPEMQWVYFIPKLCLHLKVLSMEGLILDAKTVEDQPWTCLGLQELRVRFKGLESNGDIAWSVTQVCDLRRAVDFTLVRLQDKDTVLSRVTLHLVQFKQLSTFWAGTKEYYLPLSPSF
ncbi:hypothetical protein BGZ95_011114 [Linnemannia exigua]|uniref:F-box domain-containing protein n=1 Tax=Linnemannia exigua TaxID=604196 RepID=A0AAD4DAC8_9FUNG|nr:hypothetical protein BGZ95_011114 [Linnemannia exigua]